MNQNISKLIVTLIMFKVSLLVMTGAITAALLNNI